MITAYIIKYSLGFYLIKEFRAPSQLLPFSLSLYFFLKSLVHFFTSILWLKVQTKQ